MYSNPSSMQPKKYNPRRVILIITAVLLLLAVASATTCWFVTHLPHRPVNKTPASEGLDYQAVTFPSREDDLELKGWLLPRGNSDRTIL